MLMISILKKYTYCLVPSCLTLVLLVSSFFTYAQQLKSKKETVDITSSFKPSIVKSGKIEFFADPLRKDTVPFDFKYQPSHGDIRTTMTTFNIKPMALEQPGLSKEQTGFFVKLGAGTLNHLQADLAGQNRNEKTDVAYWLNHGSRSGASEYQKYGNSSVGISLVNRLNLSQKVTSDIGFDLDKYNQYGYDHKLFSYNVKDIVRDLQNFHAGITFQHLFGEENTGNVEPSLTYNHFSVQNLSQENTVNIKLNLSHLIRSNFNLLFSPEFSLNAYQKLGLSSQNSSLFQFPVGFGIANENVNIKIGANPILLQTGAKFLPDASLRMRMQSSDFWLNIEAKGAASFNTAKYLFNSNPFIITPDSITTMHKTDYLLGFSWINNKGLQIKANAGYSIFNNLPLYRNAVGSGKDFQILTESSLGAINMNASLEYVFSDKISFRSVFEYFIFNGQKTYDKPYGLISFQLNNSLEWNPFERINLKLIANAWNGPFAGSPARKAFRIAGSVDSKLNVNYKLNKNWVVWFDLNNIANAQYQRWHQYDSYGFNVVGGFKYSIVKNK